MLLLLFLQALQQLSEKVIVLGAPGEADRLLVALSRAGVTDGTVSIDRDIVALKAAVVFRPIIGSVNAVQKVTYNAVRKSTELRNLTEAEVCVAQCF